ncbi:MAG: ABC transporter ATP-binding protein [Anaerococcus sp.]|uniref:ABC transporter ATP-binding protein n=1 Tax=Anaerococcus sp. TaxID=1872515 RepID=UPI00290AA70F|nr:ABC transporter ATP-binding protein [Anaerococcus sp.]MDU4026684.1 ABC transporter ATP-binding protein [Anaerococcus sp.]MDU7412251.1 ABC transporter ATP-binding protein [Anaerococcus sp.]
MIEVKNLNKSFDKKIVFQNANLKIEENRIYGLFARNGVGKTTLLKILADQLVNYQGQISYNNKSIRENKDYKKRVLLVGEDFISEYLKPERLNKIMDLIYILLENFNKERFEELINIFDIDMKTRYRKLSFGNQCLFRNAIGLASGVDFLFFDEPTTGLDEINKDIFYKKLMEYQEKDQSTVIISSHNVADIEKMITDVIILKDKDIIVNEPIYDIEEKSYSITLDPKDLDILANKNIINKKTFANQAIVSVYDKFSEEEINNIKQKARVNRLDLRDLFIAINEEY